MKTRVLVLSTIVSLGMIFQGCEKDDSISNKSLSNTKNKSSINKSTPPLNYSPNEIGEFHNLVLEQVYDEAINNKNLDQSEVIDEGLQIVKNTIMAETGISSNEYDNFISETFPSEINNLTNMDSVLSEMKSVSISQAYSLNYQLGEDIEYLFDEILTENDSTAFFQQLDSLKNQYYGRSYQSEMHTVISITKNSYLYWSSNISNWQTDKISDRAKRIITADAQGAVTGFLGGLITGGGALLGAMIAAPYSSAGAGLLDAVGYW